jgi:hypothetical protein
MLTPLIVSICLRLDPIYDNACRASLEQAALQSGITAQVNAFAKQLEYKAIRYLDPEQEFEIMYAAVGFGAKILSERKATFSIPSALLRNSSISLTLSNTDAKLNFRIDF